MDPPDSRKWIRSWPPLKCAPEVRPENIQEPQAEHHIAVLRPLALVNVDEHALAVDVEDPKRAGLRDAEPRAVSCHQDRAMHERPDLAEEMLHLVASHDIGQGL